VEIELPFSFEPGDIADVHDVGRVLDRLDPDGVYHIRRLGSTEMLEVPDRETGFLRKPKADDILRLMAEGTFIPRLPELENETARKRRKAQYDRADARAADPLCDIRVNFAERYDAAPCNLSDMALQDFQRAQYEDPEFCALPGAYKTDEEGRRFRWIRCGKTLRDWIQGRGAPGDRKLRDGVSGTGKVPRGIRVDHPVEIIKHWVAVTHGSKRDIKKNWVRYKGELRRISRGDPTGRKDELGRPIEYPKPKADYTPISYWAFRRLKRKTISKAATATRYNREAAEAEWGGSGVSEMPTHFGSHCMMDDTRVPALAKIVIGSDAWVGQPTFTHMFDPFGNLIPGFDLSWDEASSATVLRTIAHASTPKSIPADLDAKYPQLKAIFYLADGITHDNLAAHHGRTVVDALKETKSDAHFTGTGMATHKAAMERSVGTVLDIAFKGLPCSVDPIPLRRWHKGDPSPDLLPTLGRLRTLLTRAICTLHLGRTGGNHGRIPLLEFLKATANRKVNIIHDHDQFVRAIGVVEYDVSLTAHGIEMFDGYGRLRYTDPIDGAALFERIRGSKRPSMRGADSVPVKVKYHPDNLLWLHVWDPVERRYVDLECDQPDYTRDLPKWMHDMTIASIGEEAQAFIDEDVLLEYQKRLFDQQANITQAAEERERRNAGKVMDSPIFRRVTGNIVQVEDEDPYGTVQAPDISTFDHVIGNDLSSVTSIDAEQATPRKPGSAADSDRSASRMRSSKPRSTATPTRHHARKNPSRQDPRDAGRTAACTRSSVRPERPRPPSSRAMKWKI
jgi:hypothetical protein